MTSMIPIFIQPVTHGGMPGFKSPVTSLQTAGDATSPNASAPSDFASIFTALGAPSLAQPAASQGASANQATAASIAQVTALLQSGVPLATIIARLSAKISSAMQQALPRGTSTKTSQQLTSSLSRSLTKALSPPANAPPGSAAQQAATLVMQLQQWLSGIAGEAEGRAGQQSDISGSVLDALSAKEPPAQHEPSATSNTSFDPASLAQSLLATVTASLSPSVSSAPSAPAKLATSDPVALATAPAVLASGQHPVEQLSAAPAPIVQASIEPAQDASANASDLLGRMIVRAANVDAQLNAPAIASAASNPATAATALATSVGDGSTVTPSALAARFAAALATTVGTAPGAAASGSGASTWSGSRFGESNQRNPAFAQTSVNQPTLSAGSLPSVLAQMQTPATVATPTPLPLADPSAIVEQVVRGMTMRSLANGTSEIRLRLFPENLGEISMKLTVNGSSINASVVAQNGEVQSALVNGHQQLARSLNEAGMTLAGFSVDVSGGDTGKGGSKDRASGFGRRILNHELPGSPEAIAANDPSSSPSIVNRSTLELFNHLV